MNHDPVRWKDEAALAGSFERELLESLPGAEPPAGARDLLWQSLAQQIAAAATVASTVVGNGTVVGDASVPTAEVAQSPLAPVSPPGSTTLVSTPSAVVTKATALKLTALAAVLGLGGVGAWRTALQATESRPITQAANAPSSAVNAAVVDEIDNTVTVAKPPASTETVPTEAASDGPNARAKTKHSALNLEDRVALESTELGLARRALRAGRSAEALRILKRLSAEVPKPALGQEREVLTIEVLSAQGQAVQVRERVERFIAAHPNSPHSARLRRFLDK